MGKKKTNARNKNIACDLFWSPVDACVFSKWFDFFAGGATLVFFQNVLQNLARLCPNGNFQRCSSFCSIFTIFFGISKWLSFRLCFYLSLFPTVQCFICPANERAISLNFILSKLKRNFPRIKQTEWQCT